MPTKTKSKPVTINNRPANTLTWEEFSLLERDEPSYGIGRRRVPNQPNKRLYAFGQERKQDIAGFVKTFRSLGFDVFFEKNAQQPSYSPHDYIVALTSDANWRDLMCAVSAIGPDEISRQGQNGICLWWD